jgi:alkylated DNA repair dioxygenase AlkB
MVQSYSMADLNEVKSKKRKTLHDFFAPRPKADAAAEQQEISKLLKTSPLISGLEILTEFVTEPEGSSILSFLSTQNWRTDLSRHTIHYGGTYCLMPPRTATPEKRKEIESTILTADTIPKELFFLVDRMVDHRLYEDNARPEYCIVNEYIHSQGISAHVENFRFDEPVCALTLGDGDCMRFHELKEEHDGSVRSGKAKEARRTGTKVDVWLPRKSLLVMKGESRRKWQHEILRGRKRRKEGFRRVSLTFRVEKKKLS